MALSVIETEELTKLESQVSEILKIAREAFKENKQLKERKYLTFEEAAEYLRIKDTTLEKYQDEIGYSKRGIKRFKLNDLDEWIEKYYYKLPQINLKRA